MSETSEVTRACGRVERTEEHFGRVYGLQIGTDVAEKVLAEASDPKHGLDRMVRVGDIVDALRSRYNPPHAINVEKARTVADYIEREFGGS